MITIPMKCKLCGKIISPPDEALVIGQPEQVRNQLIIKKLLSHMTGRMQDELKDPLALRPHTDALANATIAAQNFNGALLIGNFEISPDMEADRARVLSNVHEMTRQLRISDDQINAMVIQVTDRPDIIAFVFDLRDRYEGLGRYAPAAPEAAANKPELVKL